MEAPLYDLHCHLDFADDARRYAEAVGRQGIVALNATVTPQAYQAACALASGLPQVIPALGLHPWWVADGRCGPDEVRAFEELAASARFVGEVGLDLSDRYAATAPLQMQVLERVLAACAKGPCRFITLHAVHAECEVLAALEDAGLPQRAACAFHGFGGSFDDLRCVVAAGCYVSVGPRLMGRRRGAAYARAIPLDRLLLETDYPSALGQHAQAARQRALLLETLQAVTKARGQDCRAALAENGACVLGR